MLSRKSFSLSALAGALACALISPSAYAQTLNCGAKGVTVFEVLLDSEYQGDVTVLTHWKERGNTYWKEQGDWGLEKSSGKFVVWRTVYLHWEPFCSKLRLRGRELKCTDSSIPRLDQKLEINRIDGKAKFFLTEFDGKERTPYKASFKCSFTGKKRMF